MPEIDLKKFLRDHGFRHDGDHDRGAYWTDGLTRISVSKSYKEGGLLRAMMDQVRDAERKKKRKLESERAAYEADVKKQQRPAPPAGWPQTAPTMSTKDLVRELVELGWSPDRIAGSLNEQGVRHPMGSPWTATEVTDWYPATKDNAPRPHTPEEHRVVQAEAARSSAAELPRVEEVVSKKTGKIVKKFSGDERLYVFGRIKAMFQSKMDNAAVAAALQAENVILPSGKPVDASYISTMRNNWKTNPKSAEKYAAIMMPRLSSGKPAPEPPPPRPVVIAESLKVPRTRFGLPLSVDALLADAEVTADDRLAVLLIFVAVPDTATQLLADQKLSVAQKIAVVEAVGTRRTKETTDGVRGSV